MISSSNTILNICSKLPQIITNFNNKSTGSLAFITFFLNFAGGIARLGTVLMESDDFMFRLQYIVGVSLSTIIMLQFVLYWNSEADKPAYPQSSKSKVHSKSVPNRQKNKLE